MPKGSKKRRAEKRKKEKEAHITSPTNSAQGSEDLKSQSDSGEVSFSSSATDNRNNSSSTTSNTSEERLSRLGYEVVGSEASRSIERSEVGDDRKKKEEEDDDVEIIRDLKVQETKRIEGGDYSGKRIVNIESVNDSVKETSSDSGSGSRSGSGSGSGSDSGSSSDDESEAIEKKKTTKDDNDLVNTETMTHDELIEKFVSISEDVGIVESTPAEKTGDSGVIDLPSKEMFQVGGEDVSSCESSNGYEHHKEDTVTEISNDKPPTAPTNGENRNGYEHEFEASSPEISEMQHSAVTPLISEDTNGTKHRDEATTTEISDNQKLQASLAPLSSSEVSGRSEHHSETTTPEIADKKPQVALAPPTVQPTSWKSCCGLFDVFMGSNR